METKPSPWKTAGGALLRVFQGILIGSGAILPGISGGVLCVTFGLYPALMALLAHPKQSLGRTWRTLLPVGVGWLLGFWLFAALLETFFSAHELLATALFIGLIAGSFPSLLREANREGRSRASWVSFALSAVCMLAFFLFLEFTPATGAIQPNFGWFVFSGVLWGLSLIVPGMSSSSLELFLGLYQPMAAGIAALDPGVILPMLLGVVLCVFPFARLVERLFQRHYAVSFYAVAGFVTASTLAILPRSFAGPGEAALALLSAAAGFGLAWGCDWLGRRTSS